MISIFRWLVRLTVALILGLLVLVLLAWYFAIRSVPNYGESYSLADISAPVEIVRTTEGVPHIFAQSDHDAFFALGLAHAQDRLFQMTVLRRAAQGRLSEIYGSGAYVADDLARRLGLYRNAVDSLESQDPEAKVALQAYADGVNAWIGQVNLGARGRGAPEFFLYPDEISYWEPADSIAILKLLAASSTVQLRREVLRAHLSMIAPKRGQEIVMTGAEPALPAYGSYFEGARFLPSERMGQGQNWDAKVAGYLSPAIGASANSWAASEQRTATGRALLANDPQFALTAPGLWYLARIELSSGGVIGGTIPGIPAILAGRNAAMAWGMTPAQIDDQDLFIEEVQPGDNSRYRDENGWAAFEIRQEVIRIKDAPNQTITLRDTVNGPAIPSGHLNISAILPEGHVATLSWTGGHADDRSISALIALMGAQDRQQAITVLADVTAPAMIYTLADAKGIAQTLAGAVPLRPAAHVSAGRMPAPGWQVENRWQGIAPAPQSLTQTDPADGLTSATGGQVLTADSRPLGYDWSDDQRQSRLDFLISSREVHSRDSFIAAQNDIVSPVARRLLPLVAADLWFSGEPAAQGTAERQRQDALKLLANWDGAMSEHLPEPLIYAAWMHQLQDRMIRDELGPLADEITRLYPAFIERAFRNIDGAAEWCDIRQSSAVETCQSIASQALDQAILDLDAKFGHDVTSWRWGDLHQARHVHPALGDIRGLSYVVNLLQSRSGGASTLAMAGMRGTGRNPWLNVTGPTYRGVYDLADPDSSVFVISTGQSGHPLSRHYDDMAELWRRGEYVGMSLDPELARAGATGVTRLNPLTP